MLIESMAPHEARIQIRVSTSSEGACTRRQDAVSILSSEKGSIGCHGEQSSLKSGGFAGATIESERLSVEVPNWQTIQCLLGHINMQKVRAMVRNGDAGFTSKQAFRECTCFSVSSTK